MDGEAAWRYTRIEPEAGGATDRRRIYAPCIEATAYLTDARGEVLTQREDNEGLSRLYPSPEQRKEANIWAEKKRLRNFLLEKTPENRI